MKSLATLVSGIIIGFIMMVGAVLLVENAKADEWAPEWPDVHNLEELSDYEFILTCYEAALVYAYLGYIKVDSEEEAFNMMIDMLEGCWRELEQFRHDPGSYDFPLTGPIDDTPEYSL